MARITPNVRIVFGGSDLSDQLLNRLLSVSCEHSRLDKNDSCTLVMDDRDPVIPMAQVGSTCQVFLGYVEDGSLVDQGTFEVYENERSAPPAQLLVHCVTVSTNAIRNVADNSYHEKSLKDILTDLAQKSGLQAEVHPDLANIQVPHFDQASQSHVGAANELAFRFGGALKFAPGKMTIAPLGASTAMSGQAVTSTTIDITQCKSYKYLKQSRGNYDTHAAAWHDADTGLTKLFSIGGSGGGGGASGVTLKPSEILPTEAEAKGVAGAAKYQADMSKDTFTFDVPGIPELQAGGKVMVTGFASDMPTNWVIDKSKQEFSTSGYETVCTCLIDSDMTSLSSNGSSTSIPTPGPAAQDGKQDQGGDITKGPPGPDVVGT